MPKVESKRVKHLKGKGEKLPEAADAKDTKLVPGLKLHLAESQSLLQRSAVCQFAYLEEVGSFVTPA